MRGGQRVKIRPPREHTCQISFSPGFAEELIASTIAVGAGGAPKFRDAHPFHVCCAYRCASQRKIGANEKNMNDINNLSGAP